MFSNDLLSGTNPLDSTKKLHRRHHSTATLLAIATVLATSVAVGAQVEPNEYADLLKEANATGAVRVLVSIDDTVTLDAIKRNPALMRGKMEEQAKPLFAELGQEALEVGYWNNGMGQIGLYVTPNGLQILSNSAHAKMFMPDTTSKLRFQANDVDGSLDAIEAAINANGFADVEVFLNVDEGDYDIGRDSKTTFLPSAELSNHIQTRLDSVKAQGFAQRFKNVDTSPSVAVNPSPSFRVRVDKNAFYGLRENRDIRAIRLIGFVDARPAKWPTEVLTEAQANGSAEVVISLRGGAIFSPKTGYMSAKAVKAQADANQRAFAEVLSNADAALASAASATYFDLGSVHVRLPYEALTRLYDNADPRVLSVELNKPAAQTTLATSAVQLDMASAWNAGYRAAGQNIVVVDSGVRKDHKLFEMNGVTKVIYEACFGTNAWAGGVHYLSICPSPDAYGDSPSGLVGSGEPFSDLTACQSLLDANIHDCSHGTHVAGIAAGHSSGNVVSSTLQGMAPDAGIVSVQISSYATSANRAEMFNADILGALNLLYSATIPGTLNPFVANMSFGGYIFPDSLNCDREHDGITSIIQNLTSRGIPVVAATGNDSNKNGIRWPACISQAIKVSSIANDPLFITFAYFANIGPSVNFTGPILLAPGGSDITSVRSADRASIIATKRMKGTSQAAPHAAGVYAAIKAAVPGVSVADATAWIVTTGSIPFNVTLPAPYNVQTYRRIHMPNF